MAPRKPRSHPNNKHAAKLTNPDIRLEAYKAYCDHIGAGKPKYSFLFKKDNLSVTWETIESYIKANPSDFPSILMQEAKAKRYNVWMEHGNNLMTGGYKGGSPTVWSTIMRNMFKDTGWESQDNHITIVKTSADEILDRINDKPKS